jgi:predicted amidohydrolase YtcJ
MPKKSFFILSVIILLIALYGLFRSYRSHATILLVNGVIHTGSGRTEGALAIREDRIADIGSNLGLRLKFSADTVIDLGGKPVYPGFTDSHIHVEGFGASLMNINLVGAGSIEQIRVLVASEAGKKKPGQWVRGRGWDQNLWARKEFPTYRDLDMAGGDVPIYLVRIDGPAVWVNRRVLALAGISRATPDPAGGKILRDASGEPTGVFVDNAIESLASVLPPPSDADRVEAVRTSLAALAAKGITEAQDMGVDLRGVGIYKDLASEGRLPIRVYIALDGQDRPTVERYLSSGPEIGLYGGMLTVRAIKLYADGALGSRGAALVQPYADDPGNRGLTVTELAELRDATAKAVAGGFQLCTHAIGDRGNTIVLNAYQDAYNHLTDKKLDIRFRVEHAQVLLPSDVGRFRSIGAIASMQPTHCTSDMPWVEARLGPKRVRLAYAWRALLDSGAIIASGSDAPVEDPNPLKGFYAAITRQTESGMPAGGWYPEQRMTREEALVSYTRSGAFAAFQERDKGTIDRGKWADLVVLSEDIMTTDERKIPSVEVELTVVGGKIVFRRPPGR